MKELTSGLRGCYDSAVIIDGEPVDCKDEYRAGLHEIQVARVSPDRPIEESVVEETDS